MVIESRACPSCADSVPPGRLSCPHCGAVLAAVAHRVAVGATTEPRAPAKRPPRRRSSRPTLSASGRPWRTTAGTPTPDRAVRAGTEVEPAVDVPSRLGAQPVAGSHRSPDRRRAEPASAAERRQLRPADRRARAASRPARRWNRRRLPRWPSRSTRRLPRSCRVPGIRSPRPPARGWSPRHLPPPRAWAGSPCHGSIARGSRRRPTPSCSSGRSGSCCRSSRRGPTS